MLRLTNILVTFESTSVRFDHELRIADAKSIVGFIVLLFYLYTRLRFFITESQNNPCWRPFQNSGLTILEYGLHLHFKFHGQGHTLDFNITPTFSLPILPIMKLSYLDSVSTLPAIILTLPPPPPTVFLTDQHPDLKSLYLSQFSKSICFHFGFS